MNSQYELVEFNRDIGSPIYTLITRASGSEEECVSWLISSYGLYEIEASPELRMERYEMEKYYREKIPIHSSPNMDILMCYTDFIAGVPLEDQTLSFYLRPL